MGKLEFPIALLMDKSSPFEALHEGASHFEALMASVNVMTQFFRLVRNNSTLAASCRPQTRSLLRILLS